MRKSQITISENGYIIYKGITLEVNYQIFFKLKSSLNINSEDILDMLYHEHITKDRDSKISMIYDQL